MQINRKRLGAAALALMVLLSAFTGSAAAAQPSVETSSDLTDGGSWANFNAGSDDNKLIEFTNTDAADGALVVWDPETGDNASDAQTHLELDGEDDEFETVDSTNNIYAFNVSGDQLETVPMEAGENKTVHMTIANQSDWTAEDADVTTIEVTLENTMERSVMYLGDYQIENNEYGAEQTDEDGMLGISALADKSTSLDTTRTIDGSNTTIYAYLANDTTASNFDSNFGDLSSGDWTKDTLTKLGDGNAIKSYASELPGDLSSDTSAVKFDSSGSTDALVLELGEEYDGQDEIDMSVNSDPGFWEKMGAYGFGLPFTNLNFELPDWVPGVGMVAPSGAAAAATVPIVGITGVAAGRRFSA